MTWIDCVSLVGTIITTVGFTITLCQILGLNKRISMAELAAQNRLREVIDLSTIAKNIKLIELIQQNLRAEEWALALNQMQDLHSVMLAINEKESLRVHARNDFDRCICTFPQNLSVLNALCKNPTDIDMRSLYEDLQSVKDNLTIIETHLK